MSCKKEEFKKIKNEVIKKFPGAKTKIDVNGYYYVVDGNGYSLYRKQIKNSPNVFDAWNNVYRLSWINKNVIQRNDDKFNEEKTTMSAINVER